MKELFIFLSLSILTGCSVFNANDYTRTYDEKNPSIVTEHEVSVTSASVLTKKGLDGLSVDYGVVKIGVNKYNQAGDAEMANAIGNAITSGIIAWFTYGTAPAVKAAVAATLQSSATNAIPAALAPK
jgi:hypothetical protein